MLTAVTIAFQEWRYWSRTRLAAVIALLALLLICISVFATASQVAKEKHTRQSLQISAEETFREQPARHPHRMVHYGHYVFRTPTALAALDPGVDPFTGTVMFLEGHRQNSATFSPSYDGAQAGPFARLTPALIYQLLVPLVLIVMGFSIVAREREANTDRQLVASGISPASIWLGKTLALCSVALLLLLPLLVGVAVSVNHWATAISFVFIYFVYLLAWVLMISAVSTWSKRASISLLILISLWLVLCTLMPRVIASAANTTKPHTSQIETDMDVIVSLRSLGDGHNSNDPAFDKLKSKLFEQYNVDKIEDLPINYRGLVARTSEADLSEVLNEYAEKRIASQQAQTEFVRSLEWLSPFIAVQSASMITAGTDGNTHHRFLREAEAVRFDFVQSLNRAHEQKLSYQDDINRNRDSASGLRARISSDNWRVLSDFHFHADPITTRLERSSGSVAMIGIWILIFTLLGLLGAHRLPEVDND